MRALAISLVLAATAPALAVAPPALANGTLPKAASVTLPATFAGLPVGKLTYTVSVEGDRYVVSGEGATGGVGRLASSASSVFRAKGQLVGNAPVPSSHSVNYRDGKKEGAAAIKFERGRVVSKSETPPPTPRPDRVPVTDDMITGAVDPTSALILPASADADLAEICDRTIKVFDARNLFTLALAPEKSGRLADGTTVHICRVAYDALGGHRASSKAVARFEKNGSLRLGFSPVAGDGDRSVWGVSRFEVRTRFGRARAVARGIDPA